jgi:hypothetical protein
LSKRATAQPWERLGGMTRNVLRRGRRCPLNAFTKLDHLALLK